MLTKKTSELAAELIRTTREQYAAELATRSPMADSGTVDPVTYLARSFADAFSHDNPRFDRSRFLKACEVSQ